MSKFYMTNFGLTFDHCHLTEIKAVQKEVDRIFQEYFRNPYRCYDLDLLCDAMEVAKMIGLNKESLWTKITTSPYINGVNLSYINDTVNFIHGEKRTVSYANWMKLIDVGNSSSAEVLGGGSRKKYVDRIKNTCMDRNDVIALWIKRPDGLADMIIFMHIITYSVSKGDD